MTVELLTSRALNRATLARQLLLERSSLGILDAIAHLVGLQAQISMNPYHGLWSRLEGFAPDELGQLLVDRRVVRIVVMRGTIHLVSAEDCLELRPLVQPVLDQELARHRDFGPALRGVDLDPILAFARTLVGERPRSGRELRAAMQERFPEHDAAALTYACRNFLPFVQVPPRGVWGQTAQVTSTTADAWLGRPPNARPSIEQMVLRYLAAFGPATVADVTAWCRLTGLREVVERVRPKVRVFRDERGRELFDLPDAPRPDPDTPAPPRFLPEYDNVLLSHTDRSRFAHPADQGRLATGARVVQGVVLEDGAGRATWHIETARDTGDVTLLVDHVGRLPKRAAAAISAEGRRLLRFLHPDATGHEVRLIPVD